MEPNFISQNHILVYDYFAEVEDLLTFNTEYTFVAKNTSTFIIEIQPNLEFNRHQELLNDFYLCLNKVKKDGFSILYNAFVIVQNKIIKINITVSI